MAPDSSLHRYHAVGSGFARNRLTACVACQIFLSLLIFAFQAQAWAEKIENPGILAALSLPSESPKMAVSTSLIQPTPADALKGTPAVLWRNRIQIPINEPLIQKYIRYYRGDGRRTYSEAMERAKVCLPRMTEILESCGVPAEMVSIVLVESRFDKSASYRGAGGYWQMMAATARKMGLRVDRWVDERRDPIKSTKAAAKYLRTLYDQHNSWVVALAAYNAGNVPVHCAAGSRRVKDGELYGRKLPARSAVYVSKVLAAMHIMSEPDKYGFEHPNFYKPKDFDPVLVKMPLRLDQVAEWIDVPVSQLQELNPSLRLDAMPPGSGFALRLPSGMRDKFDLAYEEHSRM